jgi:predicted ATPase
MYTYKLTRIVLNNGKEIQPGNLTIVIGPNNAGKSRTLKDIAQKTTKQQPLPGVVVRDVEWTTPQNLDELRKAYGLERYQDSNNNWMFRALAPELFQERHVDASFWSDEQNSPYYLSNKGSFAEKFGIAMLGFITTEYRLQLVKEAPSADHERQEINLLQTLYNSGSNLESDIQELVKRAFGKSIKLEFTVPQRLLLRVGDDFSMIPPDPRDARQPMQQYEKLDDQGDGIRSFVGITTALLATKRNVLLIDEPEAFLHPPQAFRIGEFIAKQATNQRQIILATHSVDVLRGILSHTTDATILRIDRRDQTNYFNILDSNRLQDLVNDPLLSSARVLDGLFYSGVVVVEADSDGRFYQTASSKRRNNIDLHFVNADNKQTVPRSFDNLWQVCSQKGLFINPCGELESMLVHRGIPYTTDKRGWITKALSLLPALEVNDGEYPWQFIKGIHEYIMDEDHH